MSAAPKIAIIADDLTGAMATAAPFAKRGAQTRMLLTESPSAEVLRTAPEIIAISTESRHLDPIRAIQRVHQAIAGFEDRIPFKKIDSTLRGNVVAETLATLEASGRRHLLITPAFPGQGRVLRNGEVFVHDVALRETAIARDALAPPLRMPLALAYSGRPGVIVHEVGTPAELKLASGPEFHIYVIDSETDDDLLQIARFALTYRDEVVLCGASGLGAALASFIYGAPLKLKLQGEPGPVLYVVGSRTPQSAAQLEQLADQGAPVIAIESQNGVLNLERALSQCRTLTVDHTAYVTTVRQKGGAIPDSALVAQALATLSADLVDQVGASSIVVTGGDTAQALLREFKLTTLDLSGELLPGIALGLFQRGKKTIRLVTKAGGFGDPALFVTLQNILRAK